MSLIAEARALMAVVQPLTGERAKGDVIVTAAPGPTAVLPPSSYAVPIIGGAARYDLLFKTPENPDSAEGWTVGAATAVPLISNLGGAAGNIAGATAVRWYPAIEGIEPVSIVDPGGMTGGAPAEGLTAVKQVAFFEELGAVTGWEMLTKALVTRFPALVLAWESTGASEFLGRGKWAQKELWSIYVIVSRQDSDPSRRLEGLAILDAVTDLLVGRTTVDGFHFSGPSGIDVTARQLMTITEQFVFYRVRFTCATTTSFREYRGPFNPWLRTRLDIFVPVAEADGGYHLVNDNELDMPHS